MLEKDNENGYGRTTVVLSWLVVICFLTTFVISVSWPTMDVSDPERGYRRLLHMTWGVVTFVVIILRLIWWSMNRQPNPPAGMPANAFGLSRTIVFFFYLDILGLTITGFLNSWAMGYQVSMFGLFTLPILPSVTVAAAGYFHSVFLFFNNFMMISFLAVNIYHAIRYKTGFRRMLPGSQP